MRGSKEQIKFQFSFVNVSSKYLIFFKTKDIFLTYNNLLFLLQIISKILILICKNYNDCMLCCFSGYLQKEQQHIPVKELFLVLKNVKYLINIKEKC